MHIFREGAEKKHRPKAMLFWHPEEDSNLRPAA